MEIKLWHLTLPGFVSPIFLLLELLIVTGHDTRPAPTGSFFIIFLAIMALLLYLPLRLLYSEKTRTGGAIVSLVCGIIYLILFVGLFPSERAVNLQDLTILSVLLLIGVSYLLAGVWYVWKKESVIRIG